MAAATGTSPSLADIVRMVHPRPADAGRRAFYGWLIGKPNDLAALPTEIAAFEAWKRDTTLPLPPVPFEWLTAHRLTAEQWGELAGPSPSDTASRARARRRRNPVQALNRSSLDGVDHAWRSGRVPHILLIEDDVGTATEITLELAGQGYQVTHRTLVADGLTLARDDGVDLLILDRQLPDGEGLGLIERLRDEGRRTPALVLSALGSLDDRVRGLRAGGDDYLAKPFALVELVARIQALLRRPNETRDTRLIVGPLDLDLLAGTGRRGGRALELLPRELKLLDYLVRRPGRIVTRSMLLQDVWGYTFEPNSNVVDVHMGRLRRKVDAEGEPQLIRNVRGRGYVFSV